MDVEGITKLYAISPQELTGIGDEFCHRVYCANETVFKEGEQSDKFFFIESGQALVTKKNASGYDEPLKVLDEGQFFGEIGLIEELERTGTVKAVGELSLFELEGEKFVNLLELNNSFAALIKSIGLNRLLQQIAIFNDLDEQHLMPIQNVLIEKIYPKGAVVFKENDQSDALYIIIKGSVLAKRKTPSGKEITLTYLGQNEFFGEQGLIDSSPRSATVVAAEESKLLILRKENFDTILRENAIISFNLLKDLSRRMRKTSKEMANVKSTSFFKGMTIIARPDKCLACGACELACAVSKSKTQNLFEAIYENPLPIKRLKIRKTKEGSTPVVRPEHCVHCRDAPCLPACKQHNAIIRDPLTGTIVILEEKCVGCPLCARACPFDVISVIRMEGRKRRVALKCTYCSEHEYGPACVRSCPTNALTIGLAPQTMI